MSRDNGVARMSRDNGAAGITSRVYEPSTNNSYSQPDTGKYFAIAVSQLSYPIQIIRVYIQNIK